MLAQRHSRPANDSVCSDRHLRLCGRHRTELTGGLADRTYTAPLNTFSIDGKGKAAPYIHNLNFRLRHSNRHPNFNGTRISITVFTASSHSDISWFSPNVTTHISISILILSTHLRAGFTSGLFFQGVFYQNLTSISDITPLCLMHHTFQHLSIHRPNSALYIKTTTLLNTHFAPPCSCF
jgi:hypothetical protein